MPIFFNLESHLWIAYLFLFNGVLVHWCLHRVSDSYAELTEALEAQVLAAFFFSIALNGLLLLALDLMGIEFILMKIILPLLSASLLLLFVWKNSIVKVRQTIACDWNFGRLSLYAVIFIVLFYNGGLIEQTSDAWWHMSLANKIEIASSFFLETGHLNGIYARYYPPLWHANLALATTLSTEPLPVLWNSFTAWGAVLKVMGFYLMAYSLTKDKLVAVLSALLFVLLPGMGDSYLRVSAWPSHIAYTAWFFLFFVCFSTLDVLRPQVTGWLGGVRSLWLQKERVLFAILLMAVIMFSHQVELLFFVFAILFYFIGITVYRTLRRGSPNQIESATWAINALGVPLLIGALFACIWFIYQDWHQLSKNIDLTIAYLLPPLLLFTFLVLQKPQWLSRRWGLGLLIVGALILLLSIDTRHVYSLFDPERAYPQAVYHELPLTALGWFGSELKIPGWHLQLRFGLLYSGITSLLIAAFMAFYQPSRATIFLAATGIGAFLFCSSPYLHHWLREVLNYQSPWRIAVLIFNPMIIALALKQCWQMLWTQR